ncbi:LysR family transcriptional regulator [Oceanimonas pelagia]|uniref:LysR family transcriptional regulator n=1 Tax=Oceanimonas pelagia TaxID=3028314 RepID=A0AA50QCD0_9GAMM|nr:LysR family transcriptional regulator [Oceanimonas pelagia]WMC11137.1 LysR family transcriptional regulator [Oceanimonas pelagia]
MLPEFKVTQLRHFVWVAELKGFHLAAEKAHRTQPAISLSIRDLESKLGEALFEKRNSRTAKTELTPFGRQFLPRAKELIAHHDRIAEDMALLAEHKTGHLRLASVPSIASRFLPGLLLDFIGDSELHVSVFDDNSRAVLKMVENQQVDFGIASLFDDQDQSEKCYTPVWKDKLGVVCLKEHPLAASQALHWRELKPYRLIRNGTSSLLKGSAAESLLAHSQYYISNMISLIAMLEAGFGITTLPWYAFPQGNTRLTFIPLHTPEITRHVGIIQLNNKSLTPPAQALVDFILASRTD